MALYVWLFECARCHEYTLICTRCLGGRQYCDPCGEQVRNDSVREAGRRYQQTPKGRRNHRLRQQRLRARRRTSEQGGQGSTGSPPDDACTAVTEQSEAVLPATPSPAVTHQSVRPSSDIDVRLNRAPRVAAHVTTAHGAEGDDNEVQRSGEITADGVDARGETSNPCHSERALQEEAATRARQEAAAVLVRLRHSAPGGRPVMAVCCCCGRMGEVVVYDGQPRIIRGCAHRLDSG